MTSETARLQRSCSDKRFSSSHHQKASCVLEFQKNPSLVLKFREYTVFKLAQPMFYLLFGKANRSEFVALFA
jgi:hypothetical protein